MNPTTHRIGTHNFDPRYLIESLRNWEIFKI
jgi:hypothetical protein